jgi:hypothetical protein
MKNSDLAIGLEVRFGAAVILPREEWQEETSTTDTQRPTEAGSPPSPGHRHISFLGNVPERRKLRVALFVSAAGGVISFALLSWQTVRADTACSRLTDQMMQLVARNGRIAQAFERQRVAIREMLLATDAPARDSALARMFVLDAQLDSSVVGARGLTDGDPDVAGLIDRLSEQRRSARATL